MSLSEADVTPEMLSLDQEILLGYELVVSRDRLSFFLADPNINGNDPGEEFGVVACDYLNMLQKFWFEMDQSWGYAITDLSRRIKTEMTILFDCVEPIEDIEKRIKCYLFDETSESLRNQDLSGYPRALTMTVLDMIDQYR